MIEQHIDEGILHTKIVTLFEYRLFPALLKLDTSLGPNEQTIFVNQLIELQKAIYYLDGHLEAHWGTDTEILDWHWQQIQSRLTSIGIEESQHGAYLNHIKKYERHELSLRQNKDLLQFNLEYFYFYKSCDVKLLRRLIFEKCNLKNGGSLSDWRYYDLITEVNDDVEDIFEDLHFINGNRVLMQLMRDGKSKTKNIIDTFMDLIAAKAINQCSKGRNHAFKNEIMEVTLQRVAETKALLDYQLKLITTAQINSSKLMVYKTLSV
jgi:hypothetical protein